MQLIVIQTDNIFEALEEEERAKVTAAIGGYAVKTEIIVNELGFKVVVE